MNEQPATKCPGNVPIKSTTGGAKMAYDRREYNREYYRKNREKILKQEAKRNSKRYKSWRKEKYPPHKCHRDECPRITTNKLLCDYCFENHEQIPEIGPGSIISIAVEPERKRIENILSSYSEELRKEQVTIYSSDEYSQEELRKLVPSMRE